MAVTIGTAQSTNTLAGLLQAANANLADYIVDDLLLTSPFFDAAYAQVASLGAKHEFLVDCDAPGAGFRELNSGISNAAGKQKTVTIDLNLLDATIIRDQATRGIAAKGIDAYMLSEAQKSLKAGFAAINKQCILGSGNVSTAFYGLGDYIDKYNPSMQKLVTTAAGSCVYMGRFAEDGVSVVVGNDGKLDIGEIASVAAYDTNNKPYSAYMQPIMGHVGLQVAGKYNLARLSNVAQSGSSNTLDDDLLLDLFGLFPAAARPNFLLMGKTDAINLARSRQKTTITGSTVSIPTVWDMGGYQIPIIIDDITPDASTVTTTTTSTAA